LFLPVVVVVPSVDLSLYPKFKNVCFFEVEKRTNKIGQLLFLLPEFSVT